MALVSPGQEITVTDESAYLSTSVGTVPFLLIATEQDKIFNGAVAPYTTKANAGKLLAVTSQRDLITNLGYPIFQLSSAGTPIHGHELNEYGVMTAYSALGSCNRMFLIRADVDLKQLKGTAIRPIGAASDGAYWLDLTNTIWGIYEWNAITQEFNAKTPLLLTDPTSYTNISGILTPNSSVGQIGSYAVVAASANNYTFYKRADNIWVQVGSTGWQEAWATVMGNVADPVITPNSQFTINTVTVTITGSTALVAASNINSANIAGVSAAVVNNYLAIYATKDAMSNGSVADGKITLTEGLDAPLAVVGITAGTYAAPSLSYGSYVQVPDWRSTDTVPAPTGSIWAKTSVLGVGANIVLKKYSAFDSGWTTVSAPIYRDDVEAIYAMDPAAGGFAVTAGTVYVKYDVLRNGTMTYRPYIRATQGATKITGTAPTSPMVFTPGQTFVLSTTATGSNATTDYTVIMSGTTGADFVSDILAMNIPEVTVKLEANGAISITQTAGGSIVLQNTAGTPLTTAGFTSTTTNMQTVPGSSALLASNFQPLVYTYSMTQPYTAPVDGTLWYYNNPLDCDIMINETTGWKGYRNVSNDARGYNLANTDPLGPILAPVAPTTQSDNTALVAGDLWVNTGDLVNFPVISRWVGNRWQLIDNSDVITQNGIVFADARWDTTGTSDPAADPMEDIAAMTTSNYVDLDCPDHRLYPRGTMLFNLRRSGYNVKQYVGDYFNDDSFPNETLPAQNATWVTASGLQNDGSPFMGSKAQRSMVSKAMKAAIDGSDAVREASFQFNLMATPGYPELIQNMVGLNNDRKNTAFVIGDTPMNMPAKVNDVISWSENSTGTGLSTADPYLGVYYPSCLTNDLQGNTIVCPASHMILRAAIRSDNVSYPWFAYAGTRRGLIDNASDIGYVDSKSGAFVRNGINQGMRDALYQTNINPVTLLPGIGLANFGNKTRNPVQSAMDRVNVARLVNYVRAVLANAGDAFLFEPNDTITRNQFKQMIESVFNDLVAKRGIYDYLVVCDTSNNTNDRIARNEMYCDIAIEPMKDVEFIYIPIRLMNPGAIASGGK